MGDARLVVAVVSVLVAALTFVTNLGTAAFQTLRAGTREVKTEIKASEARQKEASKPARRGSRKTYGKPRWNSGQIIRQ